MDLCCAFGCLALAVAFELASELCDTRISALANRLQVFLSGLGVRAVGVGCHTRGRVGALYRFVEGACCRSTRTQSHVSDARTSCRALLRASWTFHPFVTRGRLAGTVLANELVFSRTGLIGAQRQSHTSVACEVERGASGARACGCRQLSAQARSLNALARQEAKVIQLRLQTQLCCRREGVGATAAINCTFSVFTLHRSA